MKMTIETEAKNKLIDSVYLSPVVDAVRGLKNGFVTPYKLAWTTVKNTILQRKERPLDKAAAVVASLGSVIGMMAFIASSANLFMSIPLILMGLCTHVVVGALIGPPVILVGSSVLCGIGNAVAGGCNGTLKLLRHLVVPKLLEAERKAEARQKALDSAVVVHTSDTTTRLVTMNPVAGQFAEKAVSLDQSERPTVTETVNLDTRAQTQTTLTRIEMPGSKEPIVLFERKHTGS